MPTSSTNNGPIRFIVGQPGIDTEYGIKGLGYSPDNGKTFIVQDTTDGRVYRVLDAQRLFPLMKPLFDKVYAPVEASLHWADILDKPELVTQDELQKIELTPGPAGPQGIPGTPGADGKTSHFHIAYANSADGKDGFYVGGGTNLLTGTGNHTVTGTGPSYAYGYLSNETTDDLLTLFKGLEGQTVTVSVDYEYSGFVAGSGRNRIGWEAQINGNPVTYLGPWYSPTNDSGSGRISSTFVVPKNITSIGESRGYIQFSGSGTGTLSHLKLEKGSVATPWSPAPSEAHPIYMGIYTDFTQADSLDPTAYLWSQIKGDKGDRGPQGPSEKDATSTIDATSQTTNKKPSEYPEGIFHEVKDVSTLGIVRTPADFAPEGRQGTTAFVTTMSYGGMAHQTVDIVDSEKPMRFCRNGKGNTWYRWEWSTTD